MTDPNNNTASMAQVTVEVVEGDPLTIPIDYVDTDLLMKLFPHKKTFDVPCLKPPSKRARLEAARLDRTFLGTLKTVNQQLGHDDGNGSSTSGSPSPNEVMHGQRLRFLTQSNNTGMDLTVPHPPSHPSPIRQADRQSVNCGQDLFQLRKEALEAQIERDRTLTRYYEKKLELLGNQN